MMSEMEAAFCKGIFDTETVFRFHLDKDAVTIMVGPDCYRVVRGATPEPVDCECSTGAEMFRTIWYEGYRPGIMDFLGGAIKCDNPFLLPGFLKAFGR
ncbi:hypothetical protein KOM00_12400 [Geomonas sp. Red69]|uniref:SCP2 domain-containing protein n=2 Tax=Geomonas diazotrophica TaxID=2843197 RepID=A0ABX8JWB1_9BACT|nr:hypothetical protein [Geomonas diazotrophica]QWV99720.1 hypothetical protein KP005_08770 [Geomonas nitrogeniifigens]QXE88855.1 hypothetical protein KP003_09020 [Geomonas nitrogeniifigens]